MWVTVKVMLAMGTGHEALFLLAAKVRHIFSYPVLAFPLSKDACV